MFLFFKVKNTPFVLGCAELISDYIYEQQFNYWLEKMEWKGLFNLKWLFVKTLKPFQIINKEFQTLHIEQDLGLKMLASFEASDFIYSYSIFASFIELDIREDQMIEERKKYKKPTE